MAERGKAKIKEGMGAAKEKTGKVTGDRELEAKGAAEQTEGKARGIVGAAKDKAGDIKKKIT
jgi:uncharacterized protein YjbJ (UPF0337 family)